jgi:hypothetical protein
MPGSTPSASTALPRFAFPALILANIILPLSFALVLVRLPARA